MSTTETAPTTFAPVPVSEIPSLPPWNAAPPEPAGIRINRVVLGLLIGAAGIGWLLDLGQTSVPWHLFPSLAVILIGLGLLLSLVTGRGRGTLIGLGAVALVVAAGIGLGVNNYAAAAGNRLIAPSVAEWPVETKTSFGNITIDLTQHELPASGTVTAHAGAGRITVLLPADVEASFDTRVTAGSITFDGARMGDGVDVRWGRLASREPHLAIILSVAAGDIEVKHVRS